MPSPYGRGEDDPTEPPPERSTEIRQGVTGGGTRFQVFARVIDVRRHVGVTVKVDVPDDTMTVESWFTVYAGANWHERETHEMFGIVFAGHPDLRNMYLPTEFEGYPLRKDFPLLARMVKPWPGIVDVEPMPADREGSASDEPESSEPQATRPATRKRRARRRTSPTPAWANRPPRTSPRRLRSTRASKRRPTTPPSNRARTFSNPRTTAPRTVIEKMRRPDGGEGET